MSAEKNNPSTSYRPVRLLALHAQARPAVKELNQAVTILGAGDGADLILGSSRVDAAHTAIISLRGGVYACDLGAPGGTLLCGRHIRWSRLADGDELAIGPFTFRVQLEDDLDDVTPTIPGFQLRNDQTIGTVVNSEAAMVIGCDPCCDIVLQDEAISPRHAFMVWTSEGMIVRDLTGRSSVRHNGKAIQMSVVAHGDTIGIGPYELIYEAQSSTSIDVSTPSQTRTAPAAPPRVTATAPASSAQAISPTPWLDESHVELAPAGHAEENSMADDDSSFEFATNEYESFDGSYDEEHDPEAYQSQVDEELDMPEEMTEPRYENRESSQDTCPPQVKARVVAAQRALDERARKLREELETERAQLKACQDKLQEQARQLLEVARQRHLDAQAQTGESFENADELSQYQSDEDACDRSFDDASEEASAESHSSKNWEPDVSVLENIFAGKFDAAAKPAPVDRRPPQTPAAARAGEPATDDAASLQYRVSELVNMVRDEKEEMYLAENRLESLRFEIDRLRGTVLRAKEKHQVNETEHEARYAALKRSQAAIRHERESLMQRMRRLDSKESVLSARVHEAERIRKDLEVESERLHRAQEEHDERLRELRINLEGERHRLRVRQAELQRKAADLAKHARTRRKAIEQIVMQQQSELKDQESELKARRTAVTEAGRAELERAATELEQLLSARLADVETEVLSRQENLDNWLKAIWDAAKPMTETPAPTSPTATPATSYKFEPFAPRLMTPSAKQEGERGHMAILEKELEGLHRAVRKLEEDSDRRGFMPDIRLPAFGERSMTSSDRRIDSNFASKFSEKIASIRKGLVDIGPLEAENMAIPTTSKPVEANS